MFGEVAAAYTLRSGASGARSLGRRGRAGNPATLIGASRQQAARIDGCATRPKPCRWRGNRATSQVDASCAPAPTSRESAVPMLGSTPMRRRLAQEAFALSDSSRSRIRCTCGVCPQELPGDPEARGLVQRPVCVASNNSTRPARQALIERNAASAVPVKSKAAKIFNGARRAPTPRTAQRNERPASGQGLASAACFATLPSSHSRDRRPSEPTTRSRASSRDASWASSTSGMPESISSLTIAPVSRRRTARL